MDPNPRPTLAETIAAGRRLLAPASPPVDPHDEHDERAVPHAAVAVAPAPREPAAGESVPTPPHDDDHRTAEEIAVLVHLDPWTVAEHLRNGTLHGHAEDGGWSVRGEVADAFLAGVGPAGQRRVCGCRTLRAVEDAAARGGRPPRRRCARSAARPPEDDPARGPHRDGRPARATAAPATPRPTTGRNAAR